MKRDASGAPRRQPSGPRTVRTHLQMLLFGSVVFIGTVLPIGTPDLMAVPAAVTAAVDGVDAMGGGGAGAALGVDAMGGGGAGAALPTAMGGVDGVDAMGGGGAGAALPTAVGGVVGADAAGGGSGGAMLLVDDEFGADGVDEAVTKVNDMTHREQLQLLNERGVDYAHCTKKSEIHALAIQAMKARLAARLAGVAEGAQFTGEMASWFKAHSAHPRPSTRAANWDDGFGGAMDAASCIEGHQFYHSLAGRAWRGYSVNRYLLVAKLEDDACPTHNRVVVKAGKSQILMMFGSHGHLEQRQREGDADASILVQWRNHLITTIGRGRFTEEVLDRIYNVLRVQRTIFASQAECEDGIESAVCDYAR
jgi:hypothetical protein